MKSTFLCSLLLVFVLVYGAPVSDVLASAQAPLQDTDGSYSVTVEPLGFSAEWQSVPFDFDNRTVHNPSTRVKVYFYRINRVVYILTYTDGVYQPYAIEWEHTDGDVVEHTVRFGESHGGIGFAHKIDTGVLKENAVFVMNFISRPDLTIAFRYVSGDWEYSLL